MITVSPTVELDGTRISCDPDALGRVPIIMSDLVVQWGREGYFDAADPARLTIRLWDSSAEWSARIRDSRAIGAPVTVRWTAESTTVTMFRGSVATAAAERLDRTDSVGRQVWEITLTVADPTAALGNVFPLPGVLPSTDTMETRKQWLMGLCNYGGLAVADIDYQSGYAPARCKPVEVGDDSALDLITQFYDGMSKDAWTYDPEANAIRQCERHDWEYHTYLASFDDSRGAVMIAATDTEIDFVTRPGVALSACELRVPDGITITASADTDINAVETKWADPNSGDWSERTLFKESVPVGTSKRLLSNETWMTTGWAIELQLNSAWDRARAEGRRPRHPNLNYRPGHQFATERMARWWLRCWEDTRPGFINGDAAHAWLMSGADDWMPLLSPLGGRVTYNGVTGWEFDLSVQWMHNRITVTPMTWGKLQQIQWTSTSDPVPWWWEIIGLPKPPPKQVGTPTPERDVYWGAPGGDARQYRFDQSVTWEDLKYLDNTSREIKDVLT
ncbi:hypothetical protein [Corynebacterium glyciniphilum]|uniref:hypothetical protein n=1 Tax=Corynebacterium glyciniphilum TaxID=1404244 RepID=UPI003FD68DD8